MDFAGLSPSWGDALVGDISSSSSSSSSAAAPAAQHADGAQQQLGGVPPVLPSPLGWNMASPVPPPVVYPSDLASQLTAPMPASAAAGAAAAAAMKKRGRAASSSSPPALAPLPDDADDEAPKEEQRKKRHKATETVRRIRINTLIDELREVTAAPKPAKAAVLEHTLREFKAQRRRIEELEAALAARGAAPSGARQIEARSPESSSTPSSDHAAAPSVSSSSSASQAVASAQVQPATTASIAVWSLDMRIVDANDNFLEMTGYTRDEISRRAISGLALSRPDQLSKCMEAMTTLLSGRADTARMHKALVRKDKAIIWVLTTAVLVNAPVPANRHVITVMQRVAPPSGGGGGVAKRISSA